MQFDARPFRDAAAEFCGLVDARWRTDVPAYLDAIAPSLAKLYAHATDLPVVDGPDPFPKDTGTSPEAHWAMFLDLSDYLDDRNCYWEVYDPTDRTPGAQEPLGGSLADDLAGIYDDLVVGEEMWRRGLFEEAVWLWRFYFWAHWGAHAVDALRAIHWWRWQARQDDDVAS
jgi:hypothetical protein